MYQRLLELIKLIFGKNAINKTIGTRTNVIQLPNNKTKRYIKEDLNIEAASDAAAMNAKKEMEELIAEIPKMNDAERLIFENNLRRLKNRLGIRSETDPTADVFQFGTKEKVTPGGIASLTEKAGQKSPPGTLMGNIESRIKQLEASGEDLSKMKGQTLDEIMGDVMQTQKTMSKMQDEGLVRAAVRYKMMDDLKRGTLKLPKNLEDVVRGASNEEEVITIFRNNYGEDALEQVDSLIPDFYNMTSPADAVKKIEKNFPNMKPKKIEVKQTMDLDEAKKAEQENILTPKKPEEPEEFATGGRVGFSGGKLVKKGIEALAKKIKKPKKEVVPDLTSQEKLYDEYIYYRDELGNFKGSFDDFIIARRKAGSLYAEETPLSNEAIKRKLNATGGRVGFNEGSKLTDYLKTNISASTSSSSPEEGVKVKQEILDGIISLNIPLSKKLKLLGDLKFGKNRAKVDLSELGKKYGIDLGEEVYKDKYLSPGLGAEYTTDEGTKFNFMVNPEDKQGSISFSRSFANGGSTGLDYLMGIDRKNYQQGSAPVDELIINLINSGSGDSTPSPSITTSTPSTFQPTMMDMLSLAINPVMGIANIASRTKTGLSLAEKAMDAMGIGRGPGGRTEGYGVDSVAGMASGPTHGVDDVNSQSVGADASAGGDAGAAAASAAGANDGPDTGGSFAQGGIVNRTGFKFGTKFGRFWKIARKVWDDINPTGDRKYDAQLVADELAEEIFKTSMDDLPQNVQIDLYALAYNNAPKVDALFRNPQSLSEAAKKGMAASKEMESLGLDVSKNSDFFKYEEMKLSGQLGPEHQVQAYKDKIRDEFYGVIDDTLMKQVEVDDNPQRLAEVYASIKEGLEMQRKGMTPEEIIRVMKQTPRTKNAIGGRVGGLDYLMGIDRKKYANGSLDEFLKSTTLVSPSGKSYDYDFIQSLPQSLNTAINKFGFDAVIGKDGGETGGTVPGKYTPYYSAMEADSGGGTGLKGEYTFLQDYILKPENLVRDYGLEGAKKILTPYRKTITPEPTPAPEIPIAESSPTTSAPVENFINDLVGTGAKEDPILDKYSLFVENYKPTAIPVSNYQTFVDQTGILQPHIQSAFSGLSPFFKQQYQTFATANPEKALEAALQDLKFLTATGNRPSYLQDGGRVGYSDGTKPSAEENTPSQAIINRMIAQIKQMSKMGSDIDTIKEITGASDQMIKDVLGKASGGSVSKGLDYLIGY
jgi:hypothetical protein